MSNYTELKQLNPNLPILIREAAGTEATIWARYGKPPQPPSGSPTLPWYLSCLAAIQSAEYTTAIREDNRDNDDGDCGCVNDRD